MSERTRVRAILSALTATERADLKKLLPKVKMPATEAVRYPNALLTVFQKLKRSNWLIYSKILQLVKKQLYLN